MNESHRDGTRTPAHLVRLWRFLQFAQGRDRQEKGTFLDRTTFREDSGRARDRQKVTARALGPFSVLFWPLCKPQNSTLGLVAVTLAAMTLATGCASQEFHSLQKYSPPESETDRQTTTAERTQPPKDPESDPPAPRVILDCHVLLARADAQLAAGEKLQAVRTLEQVLAHMDDSHVKTEPSSSRKLPTRPSVEERIRQLGYERHDGAWIPKESLLSSYAWRFEDGRWNPPDARRVCNMLVALTDVNRDLRELPAGFYDALSSQQRITRGMNRREIVQAWGYFDDISIVSSLTSAEKYEELVFSNSARRIYLKRGHVLFWVDNLITGEQQ